MATIGPRMIQVLEFASARAPELQALHELAHREQMHTAADAKLGSQRNQRRRRANAFKSHRMPQRLRQKAGKQQLQEEELISLELGGSAKHQEQQQDSLDAKAPKQRSRKHERRPHTLAENRSWQNRNSSNGAGNKEDGRVENQDAKPVWMATHLWHSKRMKMVEKYGMMLPAHRADKSVSASLDVRKQLLARYTVNARDSRAWMRRLTLVATLTWSRRFGRKQHCTICRTMGSWRCMDCRS